MSSIDVADVYDVAVIGGGPAGATAAGDLAGRGHRVLLLDRDGRIKPCGGAIPPRLIRDYAIPDQLMVAKVHGARILSPSARRIDMPIDEGGYVGMVDRKTFDPWLRARARAAGADHRIGRFESLEAHRDGSATVTYKEAADRPVRRVRARYVIGADGARSRVAEQAVPGADRVPFVFAYHEIVRAPDADVAGYDARRCDVYYNGALSPDFYGWIFPHGDTVSIGTGSAQKGFALRPAVADLRRRCGLDSVETLRCEGAPIPLRPLKRWDDGRTVVLAGDAAGVVAPASGEGIYYAMVGGSLAADAVDSCLRTGDARHLQDARRRFMKQHGRVFWILGIMQRFWYSSDRRRERFVSLCADPDIQRLTWQSYMNKELVRADPAAHLRIFFKDLAHLLGLVSPGVRSG